MPRYAAIDIGSNSVRMMAADVVGSGRTETLAAEREVTRLGASVFRDGSISQEAMDMVSGVLGRMAETYKRLEVSGVRAVATAAVRDASNQKQFIARASEAIGAPVEIISGQEEARLIHLGVESVWPHPDSRLMIVDVGGGSCEIILSESGRLREAFSKPLGAVRLTGVFLKDDPPTAVELEQMHEFIEEKLASAIRKIGVRPCDRAIATSSTAAALVCAANRIPRTRRDEADRLRATSAQVRRIFRDLSTQSQARRAKTPGVGPRRAEIIVAGVAVLQQVVERFRLPALYYSTAGVREGIIADLAARLVGSELTQLNGAQRHNVEQLASRFGVPLRHARHVAKFAHALFDTLRGLHNLAPYWGKLLEASAYLFDVGHLVSDTGHHKHSAYIVANADLPGFTEREKTLISMLCRFHRKSMPGTRHVAFQELQVEDRRALFLLIPLLRLADALDRGKEQRIQAIECDPRDTGVTVQLRASGKIDLELWAAQTAAPVFESVYELPLTVARARK